MSNFLINESSQYRLKEKKVIIPTTFTFETLINEYPAFGDFINTFYLFLESERNKLKEELTYDINKIESINSNETFIKLQEYDSFKKLKTLIDFSLDDIDLISGEVKENFKNEFNKKLETMTDTRGYYTGKIEDINIFYNLFGYFFISNGVWIIQDLEFIIREKHRIKTIKVKNQPNLIIDQEIINKVTMIGVKRADKYVSSFIWDFDCCY